jgi:hypothetical protein
MLYQGVGKPQSLVEAAKAVRDDSRGSRQGQMSVRIQRFILRLAGYKPLVGTGPSSGR